MADASGLRRALNTRADAIARGASRDLRDRLKRLAPIGETGDTQRQVMVTYQGGGQVKRAKAEAPTPQSVWTDEGTVPHTILPRKPGGVLVFQSGGVTVFAKRVNHPGNQGTHWFSETVKNGWREALRVGLLRG